MLDAPHLALAAGSCHVDAAILKVVNVPLQHTSKFRTFVSYIIHPGTSVRSRAMLSKLTTSEISPAKPPRGREIEPEQMSPKVGIYGVGCRAVVVFKIMLTVP